MKQATIKVTPESRAQFINHGDLCVGTGHMGLALHEEYQEHLAMIQEMAHFKQIRGHGLFCEPMSIYQPYTDEEGVEHEAYCFTRLDRVMDKYLEKGIKPFLELCFLPAAMGSSTHSNFYWKGNTSHPADEGKWIRLVQATLLHLAERYGKEEVSGWPCEVWNEPNLATMWEFADKEAYFRLYEITAKAVKEVLPGMQVGGPAVTGSISGMEWIRDFLDFCRDQKIPLDFVSHHSYLGKPSAYHSRYYYQEMYSVEDAVAYMEKTRSLIDSYPEFKGIKLHITEYSTSFSPFCPINDTNLNAAYTAAMLARFGDVADSYSHWTFSDVFEERGVPSRPFHGGFGMIALGGIPKPKAWAFHFFNNLKGEAVYKDEHCVLLKREDGSYEGVLWNLCREGREAITLTLDLPTEGQQTLMTRTVDEECCNPYKCWHEMGEPASLTQQQLLFLRQAAQPAVSTRIVEGAFEMTLGANAVIHFTLSPYQLSPDHGHDYEWYLHHA